MNFAETHISMQGRLSNFQAFR